MKGSQSLFDPIFQRVPMLSLEPVIHYCSPKASNASKSLWIGSALTIKIFMEMFPKLAKPLTEWVWHPLLSTWLLVCMRDACSLWHLLHFCFQNFVSDFNSVCNETAFAGPEQTSEINQVICEHFLRQGMLDIAENLVEVSELSASLSHGLWMHV